jgi:hypothetical protein
LSCRKKTSYRVVFCSMMTEAPSWTIVNGMTASGTPSGNVTVSPTIARRQIL